MTCRGCPQHARHNYSRWQRPGNLKTKKSVFEIHLFQIQTLSLEKLGTMFIANERSEPKGKDREAAAL